MLRRELLMPFTQRNGLRRLKEALGAIRIVLEIHGPSFRPPPCPVDTHVAT